MPVVSNITPAPGALLRNQPLSFDVTDADGFSMLVVAVDFGLPFTGYAVVYEDGALQEPFTTHSTVTPITDGFSFSVLPDIGIWPADPKAVFAWAVDSGGEIL